VAGSFVSNFGNGSVTEGTGGAQNPETRVLTQQLKEAKREAATLQARRGQPISVVTPPHCSLTAAISGDPTVPSGLQASAGASTMHENFCSYHAEPEASH